MATVAERLFIRRRIVNGLSLVLSGLAALFGLFWLVWILWTTFTKGVDAMSLSLFTEMTPPPGQDTGGLLNAMAGSLMISGLAVLMGAPIGVAAGTYLAEYVNHRKLGEVIRFVNDILLSAPSIVLGLFVYTVVVRTTGGFSGYAGAIALAFIVLPVVVRTTDEMLRLVPIQMREAALSLGVPQWKVTTQILYRAAAPGIITGVLLALARISGETAPLLFTAFNNQYWSTDMTGAVANLPVTIFQFALSPFEYWNKLAWAGAFIITVFVLLVSVTARYILLRKKMSHD
ncbi:MAG: phosphate ABC transporter permease PtsA [Lysobacteraceae bacterium]|nr:MAG: phosphate ABC transporter permease PtsA [Xanthomonadaceae bacterium]